VSEKKEAGGYNKDEHNERRAVSNRNVACEDKFAARAVDIDTSTSR